MTERQFRGIWIPAHIYLADLLAHEKILWAEIDSYTNANSAYYKTNEQAAEDLGVSERTISRAFAKLEDLGCITIEVTPRRRVARSTNWQPRVDTVAMEGRQIGEAGSPNWRGHIKNKEKNNLYHNKNQSDLVFPFEEKEFFEAWSAWIEERKNIVKGKYSSRAQQMGLNKLAVLSKGDASQAIKIINQSIEYGWKGFFAVREAKNGKRADLDADAALRWAAQ